MSAGQFTQEELDIAMAAEEKAVAASKLAHPSNWHRHGSIDAEIALEVIPSDGQVDA